MVDFQFVVGGTPQELKKGAGKTVRSHVARVAWNAYHENNQSHRPRASKKQRSRPTLLAVRSRPSPTSDEDENATVAAAAAAAVTSRGTTGPLTPASGDEHESSLASHSTSVVVAPPSSVVATASRPVFSTPPAPSRFAAGRGDPFRTYPIAWKKILDVLVDHYIKNMAVPILELDGPKRVGLLRTSWFPLVMTDPALFQTVLLMAASSYAEATRFRGAKPYLLELKAAALRELNASLTGPEGSALSDAAIGAVAKMASYEAQVGNREAYETHMYGLQRMVSLRGGIFSLGLDGLLRRCIMFIDTGCSKALGCRRFFAGDDFDWSLVDAEDARPGQFVAIEAAAAPPPPRSLGFITAAPAVPVVAAGPP